MARFEATHAKGAQYLQGTPCGSAWQEWGGLGEVDSADRRGLRSAKEFGLYPENSGDTALDFKSYKISFV